MVRIKKNPLNNLFFYASGLAKPPAFINVIDHTGAIASVANYNNISQSVADAALAAGIIDANTKTEAQLIQLIANTKPSTNTANTNVNVDTVATSTNTNTTVINTAVQTNPASINIIDQNGSIVSAPNYNYISQQLANSAIAAGIKNANNLTEAQLQTAIANKNAVPDSIPILSYHGTMQEAGNFNSISNALADAAVAAGIRQSESLTQSQLQYALSTASPSSVFVPVLLDDGRILNAVNSNGISLDLAAAFIDAGIKNANTLTQDQINAILYPNQSQTTDTSSQQTNVSTDNSSQQTNITSDTSSQQTSVVTDTQNKQTDTTENTKSTNWVVISDTNAEQTQSAMDTMMGISTGGGGGSFGAPDIAEQTLPAKVQGGYVKPVSGITFNGYVYPYLFLALTLGGGALGFFIGYKFKKDLLMKLVLSAAGLMAGSAIGFKNFTPVKKIS
jgi:hypothetical protein